MCHAGIDCHKHYSIVSIQNREGSAVREQWVEHAFPELFAGLFAEYPEPVAVDYESTINWSWLYEIFQQTPSVSSITLANPFKVRLIAETEIKTDRISARALTTLLRPAIFGLLRSGPAVYNPREEFRVFLRSFRFGGYTYW